MASFGEFLLKMEEHLSPEEIYVLAKKIPLPIIKVLSDREMKELERLDFLLQLAEVLGMGSISVPNFDQSNVVYLYMMCINIVFHIGSIISEITDSQFWRVFR